MSNIYRTKCCSLFKWIYNYFKEKYNWGNISQEFKLKKYWWNKKLNDFMSKKHKKVFSALSYTEHFLTLVSAVTGCVSISVFVSSVSISIGIASSAVG